MISFRPFSQFENRKPPARGLFSWVDILYQLEEWQRARAYRQSGMFPGKLYQLEEWQRARADFAVQAVNLGLYQLEEWQRARATRKLQLPDG